MRRRDFITLLGGAAAAWPIVGRAQLSVPLVGFLNGASAWEYATYATSFRQGLSETGFVEGRNLLIDYRWAEGHYERLPAMAVELVSRRVDVIFANGPAVPAAKAATTTIPIVFSIGADPIESGFVASLNRPGGNLTGVTAMNVELLPKRLELLRDLAPTASTIAVLINPASPDAQAEERDIPIAAHNLGLKLHIFHAATEPDFNTAFASSAELGAGALLIVNDPFFTSRSEQLAALALRYAVPAIYEYREFAAAGGLMSYGGSATEAYRVAGVYAGRILRGERPAELPVQQSTRIELIINMKTAKALGLTLPLSLLGRADEVIE
jgi:putative ABC transport system substrate-binding protein